MYKTLTRQEHVILSNHMFHAWNMWLQMCSAGYHSAKLHVHRKWFQTRLNPYFAEVHASPYSWDAEAIISKPAVIYMLTLVTILQSLPAKCRSRAEWFLCVVSDSSALRSALQLRSAPVLHLEKEHWGVGAEHCVVSISHRSHVLFK